MADTGIEGTGSACRYVHAPFGAVSGSIPQGFQSLGAVDVDEHDEAGDELETLSGPVPPQDRPHNSSCRWIRFSRVFQRPNHSATPSAAATASRWSHLRGRFRSRCCRVCGLSPVSRPLPRRRFCRLTRSESPRSRHVRPRYGREPPGLQIECAAPGVIASALVNGYVRGSGGGRIGCPDEVGTEG